MSDMIVYLPNLNPPPYMAGDYDVAVIGRGNVFHVHDLAGRIAEENRRAGWYAAAWLRGERVVTAAYGIAGGSGAGDAGLGRVPVKSPIPCPKEKIPELSADIYKTYAALPVKVRDAVITDWRGTGPGAVREIG
jgi:CxxC motif-containing protein